MVEEQRTLLLLRKFGGIPSFSPFLPRTNSYTPGRSILRAFSEIGVHPLSLSFPRSALDLAFSETRILHCTAMASCCKHWRYAPVYTVISMFLVFIAISSAFRSNGKNAIPATKSINHGLQLNVSKALRRAGFNTMAALLQVSPELFLSATNSTIFAIEDSAASYVSVPAFLWKHLLQYHTIPFKITMGDLLKKPQGSCFPTVHRHKNIAITKVNARQRLVEINHVLVSHPDVFLEGPIAVHGVLGPFSQDLYGGWNYIKSPVCDLNSTLVSDFPEAKNMVDWNRIIQLLSSTGFVSFANGLRSALDGILEEYASLSSVTIFTPPDLVVVDSSILLDKIVRFHILPRRLTYVELTSLPVRTLLKTLVPGQDLELVGKDNSKGSVINGVEIAAPDLFSSEKFVVHGISRVFELTNF